ncbi:unnamed protein product [Caenorhabditis angaria]|uniref:RING-type domain-containing protein n=1 Tax=Caenorhabditis angaria TaxID=860376 RepID=A0A9P1IJ61_9PELO|nr:unnamed protein product [Caenorhabditis angaria]
MDNRPEFNMDNNVYSNIASYKCTHNNFDQPAVYFMIRCKHFLCERCSRNSYESHHGWKCPKCNGFTERMEVSSCVESLNEERILLKRSLEIKDNELEAKKARLEFFEQLIEDHLKCLDCNLTESEERLQLCETCHGLQYNNNLEEVKKCAICASCSIKKHIRNGHNTVDFFPIFRQLQNSANLIKIKEKVDEFENMRARYNNDLIDFNDKNGKIVQKMDVLTEMVRRSKTTIAQQALTDKLSTIIERSMTRTETTNNIIKNHIRMMSDQLELLRQWNEDHKHYADPTLTD